MCIGIQRQHTRQSNSIPVHIAGACRPRGSVQRHTKVSARFITPLHHERDAVGALAAQSGVGDAGAGTGRDGDGARNTLHAPAVVVDVVAVEIKADVAADSSPEEEN